MVIMFGDRRKHQRIRYDGQIKIFKQCGESETTMCENLSSGGLAFKSELPFYCKEQIAIAITITNPKTKQDETIDMICTVTHIVELSYPQGHVRVGIEFYKPEKKKIKLITKFIDYLFDLGYQKAS